MADGSLHPLSTWLCLVSCLNPGHFLPDSLLQSFLSLATDVSQVPTMGLLFEVKG